MNKVKLNSGLASIILVASFLVGWQSLIFVTILMLLFCELNDSIKQVIVKVFTFLVGYTLLSLAWDLIVNGVDVIESAINSLVMFINSYLKEPIDVSGLNQYIFTPVSQLLAICESIVKYLLAFIKFIFIFGLLLNKPIKENKFIKKAYYFVDMAVNYVNRIEVPSANATQASTVTNQDPVTPVNNQNINPQQ